MCSLASKHVALISPFLSICKISLLACHAGNLSPQLPQEAVNFCFKLYTQPSTRLYSNTFKGSEFFHYQVTSVTDALKTICLAPWLGMLETLGRCPGFLGWLRGPSFTPHLGPSLLFCLSTDAIES